jgi:transposase
MNFLPMGSGLKVWLATGHTDMRCGFPSLALRVQEVLSRSRSGVICFASGVAAETW